METKGSIPLRHFGKTDVQISALGSGGHHIGVAKDEKTAVELVHAALDGGVTFYDCCWEYCRGKAEDWLGKGLKGRRDKAFLMTKVCTHGRDGALATQMLEQSLNRLQTDHLDLWQAHGFSFVPAARPKPCSQRKKRERFASLVSPATKIPACIWRCSPPAFLLTRCR